MRDLTPSLTGGGEMRGKSLRGREGWAKNFTFENLYFHRPLNERKRGPPSARNNQGDGKNQLACTTKRGVRERLMKRST